MLLSLSLGRAARRARAWGHCSKLEFLQCLGRVPLLPPPHAGLGTVLGVLTSLTAKSCRETSQR